MAGKFVIVGTFTLDTVKRKRVAFGPLLEADGSTLRILSHRALLLC